MKIFNRNEEGMKKNSLCSDFDGPGNDSHEDSDFLLACKVFDNEAALIEKERFSKCIDAQEVHTQEMNQPETSRPTDISRQIDLSGQNGAVKDFYASLPVIKQAVQRTYAAEHDRAPSVDLWNRVKQRIEQEETLALPLEDRNFSLTKHAASIYTGSPLSLWFSRAGWGLSGAFVTATLLLLFNPYIQKNLFKNSISYEGELARSGISTKFLTVNNDLKKVQILSDDIFDADQIRDSKSPLTTNVSSPGGGEDLTQSFSSGNRVFASGNTASLYKTRRFRHPVNVDWLRSDGRVSVIHDASQRSMIFWIKKGKVNSEFTE
jgi:hypothetical protein